MWNRREKITGGCVILFSLLVVAAIAIVVAVFHSRIFPPSPPRPPLPPATSPAPASKKPVASAGPARKQLTEEWTLQLNGNEIPLSKGSNIPPTLFTRRQKPVTIPKTMPRWLGIRTSVPWS